MSGEDEGAVSKQDDFDARAARYQDAWNEALRVPAYALGWVIGTVCFMPPRFAAWVVDRWWRRWRG